MCPRCQPRVQWFLETMTPELLNCKLKVTNFSINSVEFYRNLIRFKKHYLPILNSLSVNVLTQLVNGWFRSLHCKQYSDQTLSILFFLLLFFVQFLEGSLWDHWYPGIVLPVTSAMGFKARVDFSLACFLQILYFHLQNSKTFKKMFSWMPMLKTLVRNYWSSRRVVKVINLKVTYRSFEESCFLT